MPLPKKALQKISLDFCLKNQSCYWREPSNFEDLCLVNVSVKYFSKLCFGTIKIQPELKYLKPILEDFTS